MPDRPLYRTIVLRDGRKLKTVSDAYKVLEEITQRNLEADVVNAAIQMLTAYSKSGKGVMKATERLEIVLRGWRLME